MAAPGSLRGPARPPVGPSPPPTPQQTPLTQKRANFHAAQSASLKGKSHFPGRAGGSASLPSLAGCHRVQTRRSWALTCLLPQNKAPLPPALAPNLRAASQQLGLSLCRSAREGGRVTSRGGCCRGGDRPCLLPPALSRKPGTWFGLRGLEMWRWACWWCGWVHALEQGGVGNRDLPSGDKDLQHPCPESPQEPEEENKVMRRVRNQKGWKEGEMLPAFPEQTRGNSKSSRTLTGDTKVSQRNNCFGLSRRGSGIRN